MSRPRDGASEDSSSEDCTSARALMAPLPGQQQRGLPLPVAAKITRLLAFPKVPAIGDTAAPALGPTAKARPWSAPTTEASSSVPRACPPPPPAPPLSQVRACGSQGDDGGAEAGDIGVAMADRRLSVRSFEGDHGHFSLATFNFGDVGPERVNRDRNIASSPAIVVCLQEAKLSTIEYVQREGSVIRACGEQQSLPRWGGWRITEHSPTQLAVMGQDARCENIEVVNVFEEMIKDGEAKTSKFMTVVVHFRDRLGGFDRLPLVNCHLHSTVAHKVKGVKRLSFVKALIADVLKYKVRFVVGDFNMSAYQLIEDFALAGLEAQLLAYHCEVNYKDSMHKGFLAVGEDEADQIAYCNAALLFDDAKLKFDSCVILCIGGIKYPPKTNLASAHILSGAMHPRFGRENKAERRGFTSEQYIGQTPSVQISPVLLRDVMGLWSRFRAGGVNVAADPILDDDRLNVRLAYRQYSKEDGDGLPVKKSDRFPETCNWEELQDIKVSPKRLLIFDFI
jgi:hypothetical protein